MHLELGGENLPSSSEFTFPSIAFRCADVWAPDGAYANLLDDSTSPFRGRMLLDNGGLALPSHTPVACVESWRLFSLTLKCSSLQKTLPNMLEFRLDGVPRGKQIWELAGSGVGDIHE